MQRRAAPRRSWKATALETVQQLSEIIDRKSTRQLQLARELGERVDILKVELEDTRREADIDPLTKLWNRGVFQRELSRAVHVRTLVGRAGVSRSGRHRPLQAHQ